MDRARFAAKFAKRLRARGLTTAFAYDEAAFALRAEGGETINLANVLRDYEEAPWWRRGGVIRHYIQVFAAVDEMKVPGTFEEAKPNLLPRLKEQAWFGVLDLERSLQAAPDAASPPDPFSHTRYNDRLAIELVYDTPRAVGSVNPDVLAKWGVSLDDALRTARHNLRLRSAGAFREVSAGLYMSPWQDTHDGTRLLLTEILTRLRVWGDPVAMLPHRDFLLVTGSDDDAALAMMAAHARPLLEHHRALCGHAFRFRGGAWETWEPDHSRNEYRFLARQCVAMDYAQQADVLNRAHEATGTDVHVANYSVTRNTEDGAVTAYCVWSEGVPTLLPRTDEIILASEAYQEHRAGAKMRQVSWEQATAVFGARMVGQGLNPERWLVTDFPTEEELARLAADATS